MTMHDKSNGRYETYGYRPQVDRGYQPVKPTDCTPAGQITGGTPKPPSGGSAIQPPQTPAPTKK